MHNLEKLIQNWRKDMAKPPGVGGERLDELETHLRETVDQLAGQGITEAEAFQAAVARVGTPVAISMEFGKLRPPLWFPIKLAIGCLSIGFLVAISIAAGIGYRTVHGSLLLLASHVLAITLGYLTSLVIGGLGICFVCQRSVEGFPPRRLESLRRASFLFGALATGLAMAGVALGAVWAKAEMGRYWAWDIKETGAAFVLGWQICFIALHAWRAMTARGACLLGIVGNIVVSLAWFGGHLASTGGGLEKYATLAVVILLHLLIFVGGLAPANWLRLSKA